MTFRAPARSILAAGSILALAVVASGCTSDSPAPGETETYTIGIVEQQLSNPFFAKLKEAAVAEAESLGLEVMTAESQTAGDSASQITAIENMIASGVRGIVLDPANATALVDVVSQAEEAGIIVITVNTSLEPAETATAGFETDNVAAGELIGEWAVATLGDETPVIAMLDYDLSDKTAKARHDGFLAGAGLTEDSPEIAGTALTQANVETGQAEMENLLAAHGDINAIYTINEPAAQGAFIAIDDAGLSGEVLITSIDGSCAGVRSVADGTIDATVMQFPTNMGQLAVQAIHDYVTSGTEPSGINNSGTVLITDQPVDGIESETSDWGLENCWGE